MSHVLFQPSRRLYSPSCVALPMLAPALLIKQSMWPCCAETDLKASLIEPSDSMSTCTAESVLLLLEMSFFRAAMASSALLSVRLPMMML